MLLPLLLAFAVTAVSAGLGVVTYRLARAFWPVTDKDGADLAAMVIVRVGILHALIVALAFAEVKQNEMQTRQLVAEEAVTIADVFYDLQRYGREQTAAEQRLAVRYAQQVIGRDWPELDRSGALSLEAWRTWRELLEHVLDLDPANRRQELVHARLVRNVYLVEEQRQKRLIDAHEAPHPFFWFAAVVGLIVICGCLAPYPPRRSTHALVATFAGFTGAVLYLAYDVTTPFSGLSVIEPSGFETFLRQSEPAEIIARMR
ncbi:DUF4239 domain-containing protein [Roseococcus sp. SYP-B2431]|uniref:bestrophin-like domain n=1 Tax=Roseococcus sp. SYP-B2431 TaxID=2496640 RepID=UPI00103C43DD|nr:DUF4239 domain-containing protein [Roseococcus sp. SYP-B2431]TCH99832.1 DUF4239 domain-containing protein [Roseococcus sp. SYP-B2431]